MKTEIYNVEGIEIEVERTSKDDTEPHHYEIVRFRA